MFVVCASNVVRIGFRIRFECCSNRRRIRFEHPPSSFRSPFEHHSSVMAVALIPASQLTRRVLRVFALADAHRWSREKPEPMSWFGTGVSLAHARGHDDRRARTNATEVLFAL